MSDRDCATCGGSMLLFNGKPCPECMEPDASGAFWRGKEPAPASPPPVTGTSEQARNAVLACWPYEWDDCAKCREFTSALDAYAASLRAEAKSALARVAPPAGPIPCSTCGGAKVIPAANVDLMPCPECGKETENEADSKRTTE